MPAIVRPFFWGTYWGLIFELVGVELQAWGLGFTAQKQEVSNLITAFKFPEGLPWNLSPGKMFW